MQTIDISLTESEYKKVTELATENKIKMEIIKNPILAKYDQAAMKQVIQKNNKEIDSILKLARRRALGFKIVKGEG